MKFQDFWNKSFETYNVDMQEYSKWLEKYNDIFKNCETEILDLGCGVGCDSIYLFEKGFNIIACDFSKVALDILKKNNSKIKTKLIDITKKLPFKNNNFDVIIADLTLHYFNEQTTKSIIDEINRVLTDKGVLVARVNSMQDFNHGAGQGEKLEENYYFVNGYNKRFFDRLEIDKYFNNLGEVEAIETQMLRDKKSKIVWEIVVKKANLKSE